MSSLLKSHSSKMSLNHLVSALQLPPQGQRVSSYTPPRILLALFGWEVTGGKNKQLDNSNQITTAVLLSLSKHQVTGVLFQTVVKIIIGVQGHLYMAGARTGLLTLTSPASFPNYQHHLGQSYTRPVYQPSPEQTNLPVFCDCFNLVHTRCCIFKFFLPGVGSISSPLPLLKALQGFLT